MVLPLKTKPNILLVFLDIEFIDHVLYKGCYHYGLASISAYVKAHLDVNVDLLHIRTNMSKKEFVAEMENKRPDIVGFNATSNNFPVAAEYSRWIKEYDSDILTVCGGVHVTLNPEDSLLNSRFDVVVKGDGEVPFLRIVEEWTGSHKIPPEVGVWYRDDNNNVINGGLAVVDNLDSLPFMDWNLFDYMKLNGPCNHGIGGLMLSRGCPYKCTYCCDASIFNEYKTNGFQYVRFMNPDRAIREIRNFVKLFPEIPTLYFDDDILPLKKRWFIEFAGKYKNEIGLPYWCNIRPNLISEEIVSALKDSGCIRVGIGIESGNESLRLNIMKRDYTNDDLRRAFSIVKKYGLFIYTFNMVGLPHEGKDELLDTVKLNTELRADLLQVSVFYPYKKTEMYELCVKEGLIRGEEKTLIAYKRDSVLNLGRIQKNRVLFTELMLIFLVRTGRRINSKVFNVFLQILYSKVSSLAILPLTTYSFKYIMASPLISIYAMRFYRIIAPPPSSKEVDKRAKIQSPLESVAVSVNKD